LGKKNVKNKIENLVIVDGMDVELREKIKTLEIVEKIRKKE